MAKFLKAELNEYLSPNEAGATEKTGIGMEILEVNITDQDPQLDEKDRAALTEPWRAEQAKKAAVTASEGARQKLINESEGTRQKRINESEGEAQAIVNRIAAIKTDGEIGEVLARYDAWKNAAQAGGATFFFGNGREGSQELDPIVFAKLEEIRKQLALKEDKSAPEAKPEPSNKGRNGGRS